MTLEKFITDFDFSEIEEYIYGGEMKISFYKPNYSSTGLHFTMFKCPECGEQVCNIGSVYCENHRNCKKP